MTNQQELKLFQQVRQIIKDGYGANCKTKDTKDFPELRTLEERCGSCVAKELIEYLDWYIDLIKWNLKNK